MGQLVSVLVPAYNVENYIGSCVESIVKQTYQNIEVIIVDDGSTDRTLSICRELEKKYSVVKVIHKDNGGVSSARNLALEQSKGDFVAWVDADDYIHPKYIETMCNILADADADIVVMGYEKFMETIPLERQAIGKYTVFDKRYPLERMTHDFLWVVQWGKLIKKKLYEGKKYPEGKNHEDEYLMYRLYYEVNTVAYCTDKMYFYREHTDSIMGVKYNISRLAVLDAMCQRVKFYEDNGEEKLTQITIKKLLGMYRNHFYLIRDCLNNEELMSDIYSKYMELFNANKKRCGITIFKYPELYVLPHQRIKFVLDIFTKIKHKLGFVCW